MRSAFSILKRDVLALVKNPIALLVVGALLVLPGLYAWYCIVANWDPYSHTGAMPIAIVNEDKGAESDLAGEINIGQQVTDKLKDNDSIDWQFYGSEEEALRDTKYAFVYATIVFPEDLSENLVGVFEGSDAKPTIYYYPNEKYNAVATKVTDSAVQTLIRQVNQGFSSKVNQKILEAAESFSDKIEKRTSQAGKSAVAEVKEIQADLDKVCASLDDASSAIAGWREAAAGADAALAAASNQLPGIRNGLERSSGQIDTLRKKTVDFEGGLSKTVIDSATSVSTMSGQAASALNNATADLKAAKSDLEAVVKAATSESDKDLKEAAESLEFIVDLLDGIVAKVDERVSEIDDSVQDMTGGIKKATNKISTEAMPQLNEGSGELARSLSKLSGAIGLFEPQVSGLRSVLAQTDSALETAEGSIADAKTLLSGIRENLKDTVEDIGTLGRALEVEKISELLDVDPDSAGTFISMPVEMVTEKLYPVSNYGTAVAPFYTNLALWIGCFILVSLMKVEVTGFPEATPRQRYFGRWFLFVILSLLQSQVICGVDILLGIDCANPALFMLAGAVCSFVYMNLIYALVKAFRNIGKTLCIFLLIMQVPGSSGMYPIQMMPEYFQSIHPALPFTYGIDAMREALSGLYGTAYLSDLGILLLIVPGSLVIGLGLRVIMSNVLLMFDEETNKTGFFASEEFVPGGDREGMRGMMRVLAGHSDFADDIEERAWRFSRSYPRWRRIGSIASFVVPFVVLALMLPLNLAFDLSVDVKLGVLIAMLVVLFLVQVGLIVLEYMNRTIKEETRLVGADIIGGEGDFGPVVAAVTDMAPATQGIGERAERGGPIRDIFLTDMRLGFQSVIGVVVIVLLVITPSMYAWFNIAGSWNPYGATGNLKVAVANEDAGYKGELVPVTINIGDAVVSQLRGNSNFDWVFVDADEALTGVESSKYYAAIVILEGFSGNMLTYLTDDADYPKVEYYTNQKENPIAPLITQKGADSIQESIRVSFTKRVDQVVLGVAYDVLDYMKNPEMAGNVARLSADIDDATHDARQAARELRSLSDLAATTSGVTSTLGATLDGMEAAGASAKDAIADAKSGAKKSTAALERASAVIHEVINGRDFDIGKIKKIVDAALELIADGANDVPGDIQERIDKWEDLVKESGISDNAKKKAEVLIKDLKKAKKHAETAAKNADSAKAKVDSLVSKAQNEVKEAKVYYNDAVKPSFERLKSSLSDVVSSTSKIVSGLEGTVSGIGDSTGGLSNQLNGLSGGLAGAADKLDSSAASVDDIKARVAAALKSGKVKQIEDVVLGTDPETLAANLAVPVEQHREAFFPVSNYGSSMAPFYTVLSLWVGALVMISTMRAHLTEERIEELRRRFPRLRPRHEFLGRYGIFGFIGLLQSLLVLLGDMLFLHIQCDNPVMFLVFGVFVGQIFCLVVYTITELFGDVGKALCVILLIMQVAASGGTFPVEMFDPVLGNMAGFLPFAYAMRLLQECVAGVVWESALVSVAGLLVMAGVMLVFGMPLRRPFRKLNEWLEGQLEKTGYM